MSEFDDLKNELRQTRDEIGLKLHLASMEVREEWEELEARWEDFAARAEIEHSAAGVSGALKQLGTELKHGFVRILDALKD